MMNSEGIATAVVCLSIATVFGAYCAGEAVGRSQVRREAVSKWQRPSPGCDGSARLQRA